MPISAASLSLSLSSSSSLRWRSSASLFLLASPLRTQRKSPMTPCKEPRSASSARSSRPSRCSPSRERRCARRQEALPPKEDGARPPRSQRTPLRPGGGVVFGPKPRDWSVKINRKEKRLAISTALASAAADALVVEDFEDQFAGGPKTKDFVAAMRRGGSTPSRRMEWIERSGVEIEAAGGGERSKRRERGAHRSAE
uniref:Large ribosomal subunit protein uL4c n=1 Tax=Ananas comosus var. bracteatus TaxID=296719 RepID=A0A6V7P5J2_ANACO|nr:unnamed protein product [Ananas comosus var. bracteatus]